MIERNIYYDGQLIVTRCSGQITAKELIASQYWMVENFGAKIKPGFGQIFDALASLAFCDTPFSCEQSFRSCFCSRTLPASMQA